MQLYSPFMRLFITFLGFWLFGVLPCSGNGKLNIIKYDHTDTGKTIIYISSDKINNEIFYRNCAHKLVGSLCEIHEIFTSKNVTFCLHNCNTLEGSWPLESVFNIRFDTEGCEVMPLAEKIQEKLDKTPFPELNTFSVAENNIQLTVVKPKENTVLFYKDVLFMWEEYTHSDHFLIELALDREFLDLYYSKIVFDTNITVSEIPKNKMSYWRIKPLQCGGYCQEFRASGKFYSTDVFVKPVSLFGVSIYSLSPPHQKNIFINNPDKKWYSIRAEDLKGNHHASFETNASERVLDVENFPSGAYFIHLSVQNNHTVSTLIIP